jgi:hypothetical protein
MELDKFIKIFIILDLLFINAIYYLYYFLFIKEKIDKLKIKHFFSDANLSPKQTLGKYPLYNNLQLNYMYECSKYFKYHKNTKEDIVIFAYTYRPSKNFFGVFENIIDSFRHSVPNSEIACVIPQKDLNSNGSNFLEGFGINLIPFKGGENYSIVTSRYIAIYHFLKLNINKYKRVFLSDIDDVYMFNDIFSTFNENEIIINKQCFQFESEKCNLLFPIDQKWFNQSYIINDNNNELDLELIKDIGKNKINPQVINGGIIFGGIEKVIQFLKIFNDYINPNKAKYFGYDQVLITLLVSKKKFDSIGLKLEQCTQRICFMSRVKYNLNTTKIIYQKNMCSPIVLHKKTPINWKTLK